MKRSHRKQKSHIENVLLVGMCFCIKFITYKEEKMSVNSASKFKNWVLLWLTRSFLSYVVNMPIQLICLNSVQFEIVGAVCTRKIQHVLHPVSQKFPLRCLIETVPKFVWWTMAHSVPFNQDRQALPLYTPLSSRQSMMWCLWHCTRR